MESSKIRTSPVDFFLNLGVIAMLYYSVFSLIRLLFAVIDHQFPDRLSGYITSYGGDIRWAVASLIISVPVYLFIVWFLDKSYKRNPEKREVAVRKWLVYLTLFIAGLTIVGSLVSLIYTFLSGEITTRFILKVLTILVIAGGIFCYYITNIRTGRGTRTFMLATAVVILASIVAGFTIMGSPSTQRALRFDQQRESDLQSIQYQVTYYWQRTGALPTSLASLNDPISSFMVPNDPDTNTPYEYRVLGDRQFELCATFAMATPDSEKNGYTTPGYPKRENEYFLHDAGRKCFSREIDPNLYPPVDKGRNVPVAPVPAPVM